MDTSAANAEFLLNSGSAAFQALERTIRDIAPSDIPVLIIGESGTGKKVVAQYIHRQSLRKNEPFARIVCGVATEDAFGTCFDVGGNGERPGSLLLEEIGELDSPGQRRLLHSLRHDGESDQNGSGPRLLSSTSHDLERQMRAGTFRNELYYRINGVCLRLPPLRERREDIPALIDLFLSKYSKLLNRERPDVMAGVINRFCAYPWPGNIRELENAIKKVVVFGDCERVLSEIATEPVDPVSFTDSAVRSPLKLAARAASHQAEKELIFQALERTKWNRKRAAQELRISYKSLLYKLKQIGAEEPETA